MRSRPKYLKEYVVIIIGVRVFDVNNNSVILRGRIIGQTFWGVIYHYTIYSTLHWEE